ncbi:hypothetical protein D9M71_733640 [compost metagenome]
MERMIGEKVGCVNAVLRIGILGNARHDHLALLVIDNRELHLNEDVREVRLVAPLGVE